MFTFRFETFQNFPTKHYLKGVTWEQAAKASFKDHNGDKDWTVVNMKQISDDEVEIIKRRDANKTFSYKMGYDQNRLYQRVTLNRKT